MKAKEVTRIGTPNQLQHLLQKYRSKEELGQIADLLKADPNLAKRFIHLVAASNNAQLVRTYSPIFCLAPKSARAELICSFRPFRSDEFLFLITNLPGKGLRHFIRALDELAVEDLRFCLGKLAVSCNPEWPQLVKEAANSPNFASLSREEPICDETTEEYDSLQAIAYMIGSLLSSGVLVLPLSGTQPRAEYDLAGYRLSGFRNHQPITLNGIPSKMYWLPWAFRHDASADQALELLGNLLGKLSLCDEGNGFIDRIEDEADKLRAEIEERWEALKLGVRRWLLPDGQMKLRFSGDFSYCGVLMVELHPGEKVPELSVKIAQNRFGVLKRKLRKVGPDGVFVDLNLEKNVGLLELAINHRVICWLHAYATRPPKSSSKGSGSGEGSSFDVAEGKFPPGFHTPEYMNLPKKLKKNGKPFAASNDANKRAVAYGWSEPVDGQTFRMSGDPTKECLGFQEPLDIVYDV